MTSTFGPKLRLGKIINTKKTKKKNEKIQNFGKFCVFITPPKRTTGFKTDVTKHTYHTLSPNLLVKATVLTYRALLGAVEPYLLFVE